MTGGKGPRIGVLVAQKPQFDLLVIDKRSGLVDLDAAQRLLGRVNRHPLEEALRLAAETQGTVTIYAVDSEGKDEGVREALAAGAESGVIVSSKAIQNADPHSKANLLAQAVRFSGDADLILVGTYASEASWGVVGGEVAAILDRPLLVSARGLRIHDGRLHAEVPVGDGVAAVSSALPAVATVGEEANKPRYPTSWGVAAAHRSKQVTWWQLMDMGVDGRLLAQMASRTDVKRQTLSERRRPEPEVIREDAATSGRLAAKRLSRHGFLGGP